MFTSSSRVRRVGVLAVFGVLLIEILIAWVVWRGWHEALAVAYKDANQMARLLAEKTSDAFRTTDLVLLNIKSALEQGPALSENDPSLRERLQQRTGDLPYVRAFFVVDTAGFIAHDTDYPNTPRRTLADRDYFIAHKRNPGLGLYVGMPLRSRSVDKWFVPVSRRIERDGAFAGIAVAAIEPKFFEDFYRALELGPHDVVALFNIDTTLVARFPNAPDLVGKQLPELSFFKQRLPDAPTGAFSSDAMEHGRAVISYRVLHPLPLATAVVLNERSLLAGWRRSAIAWGTAAFVAPVLVLLLMIVLQRHRLERDATVKRAMKSQKLEILGQMTGGIVHDFKNILVVTGAILKLARKHGADEKYIAAGEQALERGERLTAQLLSFAKRQELNPSLENANALLKSLEPMIKQAAGPGTVVSYELDSGIPPCIVDRAQFDAAIINLVMNAAQSMKSGSISIATQPVSVRDRHDHGLKPGRYVAVRVTDSAPAELKRVFEPFYTTKKTGTGLGLAQVYAFMHNIDGDARIASQVNAGTTVELLFPCQEPRLEAATAANRFVRRELSDTIESAQPQMTGQ